MKNNKKQAKNQRDESENLVLNTAGGEMPDTNRKLKEKASDAAKVFSDKKKGAQGGQKMRVN